MKRPPFTAQAPPPRFVYGSFIEQRHAGAWAIVPGVPEQDYMDDDLDDDGFICGIALSTPSP